MPKTLATIQTPPGRGGIAVIVLSGPQAETILDDVFSPLGDREHPCPVGRMQLGTIARDGRAIDQAVVCRRADAVEINIHGGPAVARAVMELLADRGATIETPDHAPPALPTAHREWDNPAVGREMLRVLPGAASHRVLAAIANQWSAGLSRLARQALRNDAHPLPQQLRPQRRQRNVAAPPKVIPRTGRAQQILARRNLNNPGSTHWISLPVQTLLNSPSDSARCKPFSCRSVPTTFTFVTTVPAAPTHPTSSRLPNSDFRLHFPP